jgi:hypothetical protein
MRLRLRFRAGAQGFQDFFTSDIWRSPVSCFEPLNAAFDAKLGGRSVLVTYLAQQAKATEIG